MDYCLVTGACEAGMNEFLQRKHLNWDDKHTIEEVIELTADKHGYKAFVKAMSE